jgi:cation:H+ antiporter
VETALAVPVFLAGALVSLSTSWVLVSRLERVGERLGLSEALLGILAALAADAPEITAAITALVHHEPRVGAGVVIGSNVFNLAALLGLGAVLAGRIALHRKVILLGGVVAMWIAGVCLATVLGLISALAGLLLALAALGLYAFVLGEGPRRLRRLPLPRRWVVWLGSAVAEEELELAVAIRPQRGGRRDAVLSGVSLLVVVAASAAMERAASALGEHYGVPPLVVGGLALAAITSLPNAVAANYLAAKGRGAAVLSTALTSNNLNVALGLLLPATIVGLEPPSGHTTLVAAWYVGLTALVLAWAYRDHSLRRVAGAVVIVAYLVFVGLLLATTGAT